MIIMESFGGADPAAATSATKLPVLGEPDISDITGVSFPFATQLVGLIIEGAPASGDTVAASVGSPSAVASNSPSATITNGTGTQSAYWLAGQYDTDCVQFAAGALISAYYTTTTGGTYTAKDLLVTLMLEVLPNQAGALSGR